MAIIAMLAALFLGPAGRILGRARNMQWGDQAETHVRDIRNQLQKVLGGQKDFPQINIADMERAGWITSAQARFLRDRRVHFTPFSGTDPEALAIVLVEIHAGFLTSAGTLTISKGEITTPPN